MWPVAGAQGTLAGQLREGRHQNSRRLLWELINNADGQPLGIGGTGSGGSSWLTLTTLSLLLSPAVPTPPPLQQGVPEAMLGDTALPLRLPPAPHGLSCPRHSGHPTHVGE